MRTGYAALTLALLAIEIVIALFVRDRFVRPYFGDTLAVILVYCGLRTVLPVRIPTAVATAVGIAFLVEFGQLIGVLDRVGLGHSRVARVVFGTGFEWRDLVAYVAGGVVALAVERLVRRS